MKKIKSELLLASKNIYTGDILYSFKLTYPRIILAEVNTHRMISRNTASSRATPAKVLRKQIRYEPFVPLSFGANKRGMQAGNEVGGWKRKAAELAWRGARYPALAAHYALDKLGIHKQITNRVIEPWMWVEQIFSATELDNYLLLRDHKDAEPHFQVLAAQMRRQIKTVKLMFQKCEDWFVAHSKLHLITGGVIQTLQEGQWHLPLVIDHLHEDLDSSVPMETLKIMSAARCARVSYYLPDTGERSTLERDQKTFALLAGSHPKHLSPLEHQATPLKESVFCGNFKGFKQFRKEIAGESGASN